MKWVYAQSLLFSINGRAFTDKTGHLRKKFSLFRGGNLKKKQKKKTDTCIMYIKFRLSLRFEFRNDLENLIEKKM